MKLLLLVFSLATLSSAADPCLKCVLPDIASYDQFKAACPRVNITYTAPNRVVMTRYSIGPTCYLTISGCQNYYKINGNVCSSSDITVETLTCNVAGNFGFQYIGCLDRFT